MLDNDLNKKKVWTEPILEKGESIQEVTFTAGSQYGSHDGGSDCGLLEKIITLGQCQAKVGAFKAMQVICAWCGKFIKEKEPIKDRIISHGICNKCAWKFKGLTIRWMKQKDKNIRYGTSKG